MAKPYGSTKSGWKSASYRYWSGEVVGGYVAPPVQRAHVPKGTGKETRLIGMPNAEGTPLQRAVVMLLEPI